MCIWGECGKHRSDFLCTIDEYDETTFTTSNFNNSPSSSPNLTFQLDTILKEIKVKYEDAGSSLDL